MLKSLLASLRRARSARGETSRRPDVARSARSVLNVGGGTKRIPIPVHYAGWEHVLLDLDPRGAPDLMLDARRMRDLEPALFDAVYCSHNLEHYHAHEIAGILAGFAHVLKPQGFVEVRVPDVLQVLRAMFERALDIEDTLYVSPAGPVSIRDVLYGFSAEIGMGRESYAHKTGFTDRSLRRALSAAGFTPIHPLAALGGYEIRVAAFRGPPDEFQSGLLGLESPAPQGL